MNLFRRISPRWYPVLRILAAIGGLSLEAYGMWQGPFLLALLGMALASLMFKGVSETR